MKKTYISPSTTCTITSTEEMLCQSNISTEITDEEVVADSREVLDEHAVSRDIWDEW